MIYQTRKQSTKPVFHNTGELTLHNSKASRSDEDYEEVVADLIHQNDPEVNKTLANTLNKVDTEVALANFIRNES